MTSDKQEGPEAPVDQPKTFGLFNGIDSFCTEMPFGSRKPDGRECAFSRSVGPNVSSERYRSPAENVAEVPPQPYIWFFVEVFIMDEVTEGGDVEASFASKITFPDGEPDWFELELVRQDGVIGWSRAVESLTVLTKSLDLARPLRLPEGLIELIVRAGGKATLADQQ